MTNHAAIRTIASLRPVFYAFALQAVGTDLVCVAEFLYRSPIDFPE